MFKQGQGYIAYLIIFFISMNIAYSAYYIHLKQAQILNNLFLQVKCGRLAESGINYYQKLDPELQDNTIIGSPDAGKIKELKGLDIALVQGSFKLIRIGSKIYSVGLYRGKSVIYQKEGNRWQYFTE